MDTPERNQIGTPISKIEESPFSNFINSLSPIHPIKTIHVSQTFSSVSFTSPPSVFTSPHVNLQKEPKFLRRHQVSEQAKSQFYSNEGNQDSKAEKGINADQEPVNSTIEQVRDERDSRSESSVAKELPRVLKYDSGSPDGKKATSSGNETQCEQDTSAWLVPFVQEPSMKGPFGTELNSQEMDCDNEETSCDWQSLISSTTDLFVLDSPNDVSTSKGPFQKSLEEQTTIFASLLSRVPPNDVNDMHNSQSVGPESYNEAHDTIGQSTQPTETNELNKDEPPENLAISSQYFLGDSGEKNEPLYNLHRGMRRRCLVFEMPRAKKNIDGVLFSTSSSSQHNEEKSMSKNKNPAPHGGESSRCVLPSIGLHLNALATASKDSIVVNKEAFSPTSHDALNKLSGSTSSEKDVGPAESGVQFVEDSSQASINAVSEELNQNSPKKKRQKFENTGDGEACKRCNCKKSKCLKLYCECFAAGVYCVEPCSCQDCFNKPIHEDTVLATRKQIESRNPLAFAPKVIRTSDSAQELGEDSTRTPASARHKRGCNCKKSNCLKKYCECYQGGVGCSINCRCEGCKNAFGRKDGSGLLGTEVEMEEAQACEKQIDSNSDPPSFRHDEDQNTEFTLPKTPLRHFRPSVPLPTSSKGKQSRSSCFTTIGSSSCLHPMDGVGKSTFLRTQGKNFPGNEIPVILQNSSPPSSGIKTLSPNSKRISPPHHQNTHSPGLGTTSRKLILQSIPSFPSLTPRR